MKAYRLGGGFTLIELLVVISIIGLLASVILASIGSARGKARTASVQATLHSIQTALSGCLGENALIYIPSQLQNGGGGRVCAGSSATYAQLPANWTYCDGTPGCAASSTAASTAVPSMSYYIVAASPAANDNHVIACSESACATY